MSFARFKLCSSLRQESEGIGLESVVDSVSAVNFHEVETESWMTLYNLSFHVYRVLTVLPIKASETRHGVYLWCVVWMAGWFACLVGILEPMVQDGVRCLCRFADCHGSMVSGGLSLHC